MRTLLIAVACLALQACASTPTIESATRVPTSTARALPIHDGRTGAAMTWDEAVARMSAAEVVLIGERHDDGLAHALQLAVLEAMIQDEPATSLSMEMLERDEQLIVDDHLEGIIDSAQLARLTHSTTWAGEGSWEAWYQPMIDAVGEAEGSVVAANAPRRYVRLARTDGFERLAEIPPPRRALFDVPASLEAGTYRERFDDVMTSHGTEVEQQRLDAVFRAQMIWDATMAGSIAAALEAGAPRVVHVVGQFHIEFEGGTVQQLKQRRPGVSVVTVSVESESATMRDADTGRADIVVFSGSMTDG